MLSSATSLMDFSAMLPRRLLTTRLFSDLLQTDCQLLSAGGTAAS